MEYVSALTASNRRAAYRVAPSSVDMLDLSILSPRQQLVRARVENVAFGGARVHLDRRQAIETGLAGGERVTLALRSAHYQYRNHMVARVVSVLERDAAQTVHLAFEGAHVDMPLHSNQHFALFNRRSLRRGVVASAGGELEAEVTASEASDRSLRVYAVSVRNISNLGISLRVNAGANHALSAYHELSLTLRLPGRPGVRRIACHVRHRLQQGREFIYGCEYDWHATIEPLAVAEELLEFMQDNAELR